MRTVKAIIRSTRPAQWTKNLLLFAGIVFSRKFLDPGLLAVVFLSFLLFCFLSGGLYIINDILDAEEDRKHGLKKKRPIASGDLNVRTALLAAIGILVPSLGVSFCINVRFGLAALAYVLLILLYSVFLKEKPILDILVVAFGFVIRAVAGGLAIGVEISPWLVICTILLALFLSMCKRRHELVLLEGKAALHRKSLQEYSPYLLDQMIAVVTSSAVMAYALYTMAERTVREVSGHLYLTLPFVLYGIFRYLYLVHQKGRGGQPERVLLNDGPLLVDVSLWVVSVFLVLRFFGPS